MTILIIDDDAGFRRALQRRLPGETRCAVGIREAVWSAKSFQPSVILLDVNLDGERSIDAIEELMDACPRSEIIVITAEYVQADADEAIALGAYAYIDKWNVKEICELVKEARTAVPSVFVASSSRLLH